ncbi:uracil-DNA glycosylase [Paenibacillus durus]|uniref:Uracil-DNA glycosylase-like domain-containing protein n=1 Tax=Paenibacillus durus TaxID=44251 RepID=A0A089HM46_PAEDU|nr:uracil-DNA glycosylase [Paenibacillus durus]AIQ11418.1 hypothetical protein PDUR_05085 [Paenibacillus durus]
MDVQKEPIKLKATDKRVQPCGEGDSPKVNDSWLHLEVAEEENFNKKVHALIRSIASKQDFPSVNNFYAESVHCRTNLAKYFNALFWSKPKVIFIGEAPGVRGCALTGTPFTSERILRGGRLNRHFPRTSFYVEGNSYEGSAHYFWETIDLMTAPPVLWNVFPLHPYKIVQGVMKNRTPKSAEKKWGREILQQVMDLFPNVQVVSVGNNAKDACATLGIITTGHIIHPAYHANEFREQMRSFITG